MRPGTPGRRQQNPRIIKSIGHTSLGCLAQGLDDVRIFQLIHLGDDSGMPAGALVFDLALDQLEQPRSHGERRHQQCRTIGPFAWPVR